MTRTQHKDIDAAIFVVKEFNLTRSNDKTKMLYTSGKMGTNGASWNNQHTIPGASGSARTVLHKVDPNWGSAPKTKILIGNAAVYEGSTHITLDDGEVDAAAGADDAGHFSINDTSQYLFRGSLASQSIVDSTGDGMVNCYVQYVKNENGTVAAAAETPAKGRLTCRAGVMTTARAACVG